MSFYLSIYLPVTPIVYKQRTLLKVFEPDFVLWGRVIGVEPHFLATLRLTDLLGEESLDRLNKLTCEAPSLR